jgi:hypothetical protein
LQLRKKEKKTQQRFSSNPAEAAEQSASSMMSREMLCTFPSIADGTRIGWTEVVGSNPTLSISYYEGIVKAAGLEQSTSTMA